MPGIGSAEIKLGRTSRPERPAAQIFPSRAFRGGFWRKSSTRARIVENPLIRVWEAAFWEKAGKVRRAGQFLPLRQFVDLQHDREIFLTQIGRLGLELMLQLAQIRLIGMFGFR